MDQVSKILELILLAAPPLLLAAVVHLPMCPQLQLHQQLVARRGTWCCIDGIVSYVLMLMLLLLLLGGGGQ